MSTNPIPDPTPSAITRMLKRIMRRQGVEMEKVPNIGSWKNFILALDQMIEEFNTNRELLEQSVQSTSLKLKQAYEDLKAESSLRLAQADLHQRELENLVQKRTAELKSAQRNLEKINKRLEYDAMHDGLTGLANRNQLMRELNSHVAKLVPNQEIGLCFFFIDFDRFKQINDRFGHLIGDKVLMHVANRLSELVYDTTCLARIGGDEFVFLLDKLTKPEAIALAQDITATFTCPIRIRGIEIPMSVSVGIVLADASYQSADEIVRDADIAMYRAKKIGNSYQLFDEEMRTEHLAKLELERELEVAVREKQFQINFEPIIDPSQSKLFSIESLVRWIHPEKGIISPGQFIPLAEELGLVIEIDRIVFEKTCEYFSQWKSKGITSSNQKFNVNIACGQLERSDLIPFLLNRLELSDIPPQDVILEITESYWLANSGMVMKNLKDLNELGFNIFVDDFGTGYSSLSYLANYPIHGLKIDRSFIKELDHHPENKELIRSIIAMAEALNIMVVTEGVETIEQLQVVQELGCHYIQGFLLTRPMNAMQAEVFQNEKPYQRFSAS